MSSSMFLLPQEVNRDAENRTGLIAPMTARTEDQGLDPIDVPHPPSKVWNGPKVRHDCCLVRSMLPSNGAVLKFGSMIANEAAALCEWVCVALNIQGP